MFYKSGKLEILFSSSPIVLLRRFRSSSSRCFRRHVQVMVLKMKYK